MAGKGIDHFVVGRRANMAYLTGFEGLFHAGFAGLVLVSRDEAVLFTDRRYGEQATSEARATGWRVVVTRGSPAVAAAALLRRRVGPVSLATGAAGCRVGVEIDVSHRLFVRFAEALSREPAAVEGLVEEGRRTKSADELAAIERAALVTDRAFECACGVIKPGVGEREIARAIDAAMIESGASATAFDPIVASGPNASKPHAETTDRVVEAGDLVEVDIGAVVDGYCADMTRTVAVGRIDRERRTAYAHVLEAQERALGAARVGMTGRELDSVARGYLDSVGLGDLFVHGLGHGVGLDVHELPTIGRTGRRALKAGDVFTIEPGVYLPGQWGIRIEDLVALTGDGLRVLSRSTKTLVTL